MSFKPTFRRSRRNAYTRSRMTNNRSARRRRTMARKRMAAYTSVIPNPITARRTFVKLKYVTDLYNDYPIAPFPPFINQRFSLTDMYDPDWSGIGHQPRGFDQYASFYGKYRVHACKVRIQFVSSGTSNNFGFVGMLPQRFNDAQPTNINDLELPYAKSNVWSTKGGPGSSILTGFYKTKQLIGVTDIKDDAFEGSTTADTMPTSHQPVLDFFITNYNTYDAPWFFNSKVELTYYAEFSESKQFASS